MRSRRRRGRGWKRGGGWIVLLNLRRMGLGGEGCVRAGNACCCSANCCLLDDMYCTHFWLMLNDSFDNIPLSNRQRHLSIISVVRMYPRR